MARFHARLEKALAEAASKPPVIQDGYNRALSLVDMLIDNLCERIEWHREDARRKGVQYRPPPSMAGELETLSRIVNTLQSAEFDRFRRDDPNAGGQAICRILDLARKEFGNVEGTTPRAAGEDSPDNSRQGATPDAGQEGSDTTPTDPPAITRRYSNRGRVIRLRGGEGGEGL